MKYPWSTGRLLRTAALHTPARPGRRLGQHRREPRIARRDYQQVRGMGGFVRVSWESQPDRRRANVYTIKKYGRTA